MFPSVPADRLHCVQMVRTLRFSDDISHLDSVSDVMYPPDRTYILPTKKQKSIYLFGKQVNRLSPLPPPTLYRILPVVESICFKGFGRFMHENNG